MRYLLITFLFLVTPSASAQNGFLQIFVFEGGIEVTVEGRSPEMANMEGPLEFGLEPGSYRITARKSGYEDLIRIAEIEKDKLTQVHVNLLSPRPQERQLPYDQFGGLMAKSGILRVRSAPTDAPVYVDGALKLFRTPMEVAGLAVGYYIVQVGGCEVSAPIREDVVTYVECQNGTNRVTFSGEPSQPLHIPDGAEVMYSPVEELSGKRRKGIELGMGLASVSASGEGETHTGPGMHATLGYGLSERYTVGLSAMAGRTPNSGTKDGHSTNSVIGLFGRMYFLRPQRTMRPFLTLGAGQSRYSTTLLGADFDATGLAGMLGLGLDWATSRSLGYYIEADFHRANFDTVEVAGIQVSNLDLKLTYIVVAAGLRLRF
ncbi:MAG TPA: hypothetical protein DCY57_00865 [Bacteroidetes bacterium]|nr:hypothetical protein [Bacteroidota bacterium]